MQNILTLRIYSGKTYDFQWIYMYDGLENIKKIDHRGIVNHFDYTNVLVKKEMKVWSILDDIGVNITNGFQNGRFRDQLIFYPMLTFTKEMMIVISIHQR